MIPANDHIPATFLNEALRTLMRALPIAPDEPDEWANRRRYAALYALSSLRPRDPTEVMLGVQAIAAYHAAAAGWYLGMNKDKPEGEALKHFASAASAARTFDTLLKSIERRQAKPLAEPFLCFDEDPNEVIQQLAQRCGGTRAPSIAGPTLSPQETDALLETLKTVRANDEYQGIDLSQVEGLRPDGSIIFPENPNQATLDYCARRYCLNIKRGFENNLRHGINELPKLKPLKPGDLIP